MVHFVLHNGRLPRLPPDAQAMSAGNVREVLRNLESAVPTDAAPVYTRLLYKLPVPLILANVRNAYTVPPHYARMQWHSG